MTCQVQFDLLTCDWRVKIAQPVSGDGDTFIGTVQVIDFGISLPVFAEFTQFNAVKLRSSRLRQQGKSEGDA